MKTQKLYYGVAYYDEYMPYDRIETDMQMMKDAGINVIRIAESTWSTMEPQDGVFDFTHLNRMLDASKKYGLSVIIGTPTYAIPTWMVRQYPDILAFSHNGQEIYGHRQNMDITHPDYLRHSERIIRKMMEEIKDRENIIGFQLDNETKPYDTCCDRVQKRFVEYLKVKFPDIDAFNLEFGLDYWSNRINTWEDFPDVRGTINGSLGAEFEKFQRSLVTDFFEWQAAIINEYRRKDQFITHNFDFSWSEYSVGLQPQVEQYSAAKCMDVAGADIYHPSAQDLTGTEISACGAITRGIKQDNYLILETDAQGCFGWLPYEGQLRLQAFSHIANGANSVMYWHWHSIHNAIETYWKGLLSHDLKANTIYKEAMQIGSEFAKYGDKLKNLQKKNKVAFLLSNRSLTGMEWFPINENLNYNDIFRWLYDAFYRMNVEADVIYDYQDTLNFSDYELIVAPALYATEVSVLEQLKEYTASGGHLLTTFKSAFSNENLKVFSEKQPYLLSECLGITYDQFTKPVNVGLESDLLSFSADAAVSDFMELVHVLDCCTDAKASTGSDVAADTVEILASYKHKHWGKYAAATFHKYGKGSAAYLGCHMDSASLEVILKELFHRFELVHPDYYFPIIVKEGTNDYGEHVVYLFNYSDDDITVPYHFEDSVNLMTGEPIHREEMITVKSWDFVTCIGSGVA